MAVDRNWGDERRLLLRLKGKFDTAAAQSLSRRLDAAGAWPALIDFTDVTQIEDSSLGFLAEAILRHGERVALTGLGGHQLRLLAWLGVGDQPAPHAP